MTREIRTETRGWLFPKVEVIYEDGDKVGEIRTESTFFGLGKDIKVEYNSDDDKVSETHREKRGFIFREEVDVVYDADGDEVREEHHQSEERLAKGLKILSGAFDHVDVTRDEDGNKLRDTHYERKFMKGVSPLLGKTERVKIIEDFHPQPKETESEDDETDSESYDSPVKETPQNYRSAPQPKEIERTKRHHPRPSRQIKPSSPKKTARETLVERVLSMESYRINDPFSIRSDGPYPEEALRHEIILRKVMDKSNNIYSLIFFSKDDSEWRPYAQRRLEEIMKKHPEIKNISSRDAGKACQYLAIEDEDGSKALAEARTIQKEREEIERIGKLTDIDEVYRLSQMGGDTQYFALQRYREMEKIRCIEQSKPGYILKTIFKAIFGIK